MATVNYVIAVWGGDRRGGIRDIIYCKKQIEQLLKLKHSLTQITICISNSDEETQEFKDYISNLKQLPLPIVILRRENIGLSYGSYSHVYGIYRDQFDYYIFMEDDYYFCRNHFDRALIEIFENTANCGYVCGYVSQANNKRWMGNSNGLTSSRILEEIWNKYECLPFDKTCIGPKYTEESGQITFSDAFTSLGYILTDITKEYEILHYYWQHTNVKPIPSQKNLGSKNFLLLPYEADFNIASSPFNVVFEKFKGKHKGQEAIVFATGPTLNAYDYKEDDGTRIKVGVNSIALKPLALDYYFCGHVDIRSKPYINDLKNYNVGIEKFGYVTLDGISSGQWLTLQKAKDLGLKPYGLTTRINFGADISKACLTNHLIIFSAIQFLLYTEISKIYLVGSDATQLISCDDYAIDTDRNIERVRGIFEQLAKFAKGKTEIVSINPVGLRGIFADIYRTDVTPYLPPKETPLKDTNYSSAQNQTILDATNNNGYTSRY